MTKKLGLCMIMVSLLLFCGCAGQKDNQTSDATVESTFHTTAPAGSLVTDADTFTTQP